MRKLLFVFLALLLVTFTGCQPADVPDAAVSSIPSDTTETTPSTSSMDISHNEGTLPESSSIPNSDSASSNASSIDTEHLSSANRQDTETTSDEFTTSSQAAPTTSSRPSLSQPTQVPRPSEPSEPVSSIPETPQAEKPDPAVVAQKVAEYINQYRNEQGDTTMTVLPGLTKVAEYRSRQLVTNFSHDFDEDPCMILKYGELVDMTELGLPESHNYYVGYNAEAIGKGRWTGTADEIAQKIATGFRNSAGHWSYVGSSEYSYMAVGVTYNPSTWDTWYCCVCVSSKDYGG